MTFDKFIQIIPEEFLDGAIQRLHGGEDPETIGDSIPVFIYQELKETFDVEAPTEEQAANAMNVLRAGTNEINQAMGYIQRKLL